MPFTFHHYLPADAIQDKLDSCALTLAVHERLQCHGIPATLHTTDDADAPLVCCFAGSIVLPPHQAIPTERIHDSAKTHTQAINAMSWKGIAPDEMKAAMQTATKQVNTALRKAMQSSTPGKLESRLAQAMHAGFDVFTILYHETRETSSHALASEGFNMDADGPSRRDHIMPRGMFLKTTSNALSLHEDSVQVPFIHRPEKVLRVSNRDVFKQHIATQPSLAAEQERIEQKDAEFDKQAGNLIDALKDAPSDPKIKSDFDALLATWRKTLQTDSDIARRNINAHFQQQGYRFISLTEDAGSLGRQTDALISLDPVNDVRAAHIDHVHRKPTRALHAGMTLKKLATNSPQTFHDSLASHDGPRMLEALSKVMEGARLSEAEQHAISQWLPDAPLAVEDKHALAEELSLVTTLFPSFPVHDTSPPERENSATAMHFSRPKR